jgi:glycosyltransferase involved in cell wall biosynthesis
MAGTPAERLMRVVMAANWWYRRGGAGAVMMDEAEALGRSGHDVIPFASAHPDNLATRFDRYFPSYTETERGGAGLSVAERVSAAIDLIYDKGAADQFTRLLRDTKPDLVHLHNPSRQLSPSVVWAARRERIPVVMTLHDFALICPQGQMLKGDREACRPPNCVRGNVLHAITNTCVKQSYVVSGLAAAEHLVHRSTRGYTRGVTRLIAPSRFMASTVRSAGIGASAMRVVPNGIPDIRSMPRPGAGRYLLYQGRLSREKGLDVLSAAARLAPDVPIALAGDGPMRADLEASSVPSLRMLGLRTPDQLIEDVDQAVAIISPSTGLENAPLAVIEGLRAGRPVIASDIGGQPELIDAGSGVLVPAGDPGALADAMRRLWQDRDQADALGAAARRSFLDHFTIDHHMAALLAVYDEAIRAGQGDLVRT